MEREPVERRDFCKLIGCGIVTLGVGSLTAGCSGPPTEETEKERLEREARELEQRESIVVRTANVTGASAEYGRRMDDFAVSTQADTEALVERRLIHTEPVGYPIGLIGVTEVRMKSETSTTGRLAEALEAAYGTSCQLAAQWKEEAAVSVGSAAFWDGAWEQLRVTRRNYDVYPVIDIAAFIAERECVVVWLRNITNGYVVRFYVTHLQTGDTSSSKDERKKQLEQLGTWMTRDDDARPFGVEMPPILVGDTNVTHSQREDEMWAKEWFEERFEVASYDAGMADNIYFGKPAAFPNCQGEWALSEEGSTDTGLAGTQPGAAVRRKLDGRWHVYYFSGRDYWRCDVGSREVNKGLTSVAAEWKGWTTYAPHFTDGVDAAVYGKRGAKVDHAYFFKGDQYIAHTFGEGISSRPAKIADDWDLPSEFHRDLDAAMSGAKNMDDPTLAWLFKGSQVVKYDLENWKMSSVRSISDEFRGLPDGYTRDLESAVAIRWDGQRAALFQQGHKTCIYDLENLRVLKTGYTDREIWKFKDTDFVWPGTISDHSVAPRCVARPVGYVGG